MARTDEIGRIGQKRYGGTFYEEFLRELRGKKGIETYREMAEKRRIQEYEGIGIERDLAGLPVFTAPEDTPIWDDTDPDMVKLRAGMEDMVRKVRVDELAGIVKPAGFEFELLSSGGSKQFDTNAIIQRYDTGMAMTVLADFIFLGHQQVGSFALSSDKTELFAMAIGAYLDIICETFNSQGIPSLIDINGSHFEGITDYPKLAHGDIENADIQKLAAYIKDMTGVGILVPDDALEDYVREAANLPDRTSDTRVISDERRKQQYQNEPPAVSPEEAEEEELSEGQIEAAKKRLGRSG